MDKLTKFELTIHLSKALNKQPNSDESAVVDYLLRCGHAHDIIYPNVPRLALFNKLNAAGLEVLYDGTKMYLSPNALNNYYENVMFCKEKPAEGYVTSRSIIETEKGK